jgi:hypothetical protein
MTRSLTLYSGEISVSVPRKILWKYILALDFESYNHRFGGVEIQESSQITYAKHFRTQ